MVKQKVPEIFRKRKKLKDKKLRVLKKTRKIKKTRKGLKPDNRAPPIEESEGYCSTEPKTVVVEIDENFNIISRKVLNTTTNELIDLI